jgi:ribosomal protein L37AE/L43A
VTPDERARLRELITQARRERAEREELVESERQDRFCAHCGELMPLGRVGSGAWPARFCGTTCRQRAYRRRRAVPA